jgi:plastocyanin
LNAKTILLWAAVIEAGLFAAFGLRQIDREAIAFALLYILGAVFLRLGRRGLVGSILLLLLSLDTAFWMVTATVSNLQSQSPIVSVLEPLALSIVSAVAIIAAVGSLIQRGVPAGARLPALAAAFIAVSLIAFAGETVLANNATGPSGGLALTIHNTAYSAKTLGANSGQVSISVKNQDLFWHTFTIDKLGVNVAVPVGSNRQIIFNAPPGTYTFYCAIPGHRQAGMVGTITVQ